MAQATGKKRKESFFTGAFSSFSVDDVADAKKFYGQTLGLDVTESDEGLQLAFDDGHAVFIYAKDDHEPATFTVLNFNVDDIDKVVQELKGRGITFEAFTGELETDNSNIFRGKDSGHGPNIAWFKDPAGNFLSVVQE